MPAAPAELWTCERCASIGSTQQAQEHEAQTGHTVRRLTAAEANGVREIWQEEGRDEMGGSGGRSVNLAAELIGYARAFRSGGLDGPDF